jgi:hypothetical protein
VFGVDDTQKRFCQCTAADDFSKANAPIDTDAKHSTSPAYALAPEEFGILL